MDKNYQRVKSAIDYLHNNYRIQPSLNDLSKVIHLSPYHLQRLFRRWAGVSPKQFLQCVTLKNSNNSLRNGLSVLRTSQDVGLSSSSRLHDLYISFHAMTPTQYRLKGQGVTIYYGLHNCPLGFIVIGITNYGICNLFFTNTNNLNKATKVIEKTWPNAVLKSNSARTKIVADKLFSYGQHKEKVINLRIGNTNSRTKLWQALLQIPNSDAIPPNQSTESVFSKAFTNTKRITMSKNRIALLVPCHGEIRAAGLINGYA